MRLWVSLILLVSLSAGAQSVKYYALTPQETKRSIDIRAAKDAAIKAVADYDMVIAKKYAMDMIQYPTAACAQLFNKDGKAITPNQCPPNFDHPSEAELEKGRDYKWKDGWYNGMQYSEDFKIILPATAPKYTGNGTTCFYPSGGYYNQFGPADFNYGPNGMLNHVVNTPVPISSGYLDKNGEIVDQYGHMMNLH